MKRRRIWCSVGLAIGIGLAIYGTTGNGFDCLIAFTIGFILTQVSGTLLMSTFSWSK